MVTQPLTVISRQAPSIPLPHRLDMLLIGVAIEGTFTLITEEKTYANCQGLILDQGISRLCHYPNASILIFFIGTWSDDGRRLKKLLNGEKAMETAPFFTPSQQKLINKSGNSLLPYDELKKIETVIKTAIIPQSPVPSLDPRVLKGMEFINENYHKPIQITDLANHLNLSLGRTRHLFAEETQSTFTQYLLWVRTRNTILATAGGESLTAATIQHGFADQAHFSRAFKRMFGQSPGLLIKNSPYVQVLEPLI